MGMLQKKGYDRSIIEKLRTADWSSILPRLVKYARAKEVVLNAVGSEKSYEDIIQEAIARVYGQGENGRFRNWDSEKYPDLGLFLKFIVKEIVQQEITQLTGYSKEQLCWEDDPGEERELDVDNTDSADSHTPVTPENSILDKENIVRLPAKIDEIANGDYELGLVTLCIHDGTTKSSQIADEIELPIKDVYNLKKRLKRRLEFYNGKTLD